MKLGRKAYALLVALIAGIGISSISGCSDPETSARKLHNEAITADKDGRADDSLRIYEQIVAEFPGTQTAVEANQRLLAISRVMEKQKDVLRDVLDMYRLENGRYPTTEEGLSALVTKPAGARNWKGPYLEDPAVIELFSYRIGPSGPELEPK